MAKIVPGRDVGLEGQGRVRVSTSRARRGKILAVEHPIFGWVPYRQWAVLRLVPEERILPSIIVGASTFLITVGVMEKAGVVLTAAEISFGILGFGPFPTAEQGFALAANFPFIGPFLKKTLEDVGVPTGELPPWEKHPLPFYVATMAAGLTLAGLDPGMALRAFAELLNAIIPL